MKFNEKRSDAGNGDSSCLVINNADNPEDMIDKLILPSLDFNSIEPEFPISLSEAVSF